jgi:hypothetical protein
MYDYGVSDDHGWGWDMDHLLVLDTCLEALEPDGGRVELSLSDVDLLLSGMAFTEVASAELPWIDLVRWTSDFVTAELRSHWTEEEWQRHAAGGGRSAW